jgi:hypothetical protein
LDPDDSEISPEDAASLLVFAAAQAPKKGMELIKLLLVFGLSKYVNAVQDETGMTALHAACEVGHFDTARLLVKYKAKKTVIDEMGQTPLHKACGASLECVQLMLGIEDAGKGGGFVNRRQSIMPGIVGDTGIALSRTNHIYLLSKSILLIYIYVLNNILMSNCCLLIVAFVART